MNDEFLYRLRAQPSWRFATRLKSELDRQAAAAESRKHYIYVLAMLLLGGTALAFISPRVRDYAATIVSGESETDSVLAAASTPENAAPRHVAVNRSTSAAAQPPNLPAPDGLRKPISPARDGAVIPSYSTTGTTSGEPDNPPLRMSVAPPLMVPASIEATVLAGGTIRIDGSSAVFPLAEAVAQEFQIQTRRKTRVTVGIGGTGGGFRKFCRGQIDIAMASRPILRSEMQACAVAGVKFVELPVAYDALAVIVNREASWLDQITIDELRVMWAPTSQRVVNSWNQVNAAWPEAPLMLVGPGVDSGAFDYFTQAVNGRSKSIRGDYDASDDENVIVQKIAENKNASAFTSLPHIVPHANRVKVLKIVNSSGDAVSPSVAAVQDGTYNPFSRPLFIYVSSERLKNSSVREFVEFFIVNAAYFADQIGYVPLTERAHERTIERLDAGTLGTVFGGRPEVRVSIEQALERDAEL